MRLVAERIIAAVAAPQPVYKLCLGVSIGIAIYPDDGADADQLLARADGAMYEAKDRGRNRYEFAGTAASSPRSSTRQTWSPNLKIGVEPIDAQHEELFAHMSGLWEAMLAGADQPVLSQGMGRMMQLLEQHFAAEDACMAAHPYAGDAEHRADHERALETARSLAAHVDPQSLLLAIRFLYDWLQSHIRSYDAELARAE